MALRGVRVIAVAVSALVLVGALAAASVASPTSSSLRADSSLYAGALTSSPSASLDAMRLRAAPITWRGGPITTSTGETVTVRVSDSVPADVATPEGWAEFFAGLTHGPELSLLTAYIATFEEVQDVCGERALGCYGNDQLFVPAEIPSPDTTVEEVVRHEYGHHVAFHRTNAPWVAVDWGPKRWASVADVCARATRKEAFPGDEGLNYALNPGEAWAEVYRLMDERKAGIATASWPIIDLSFYPSEIGLQAAERDVLQPWTASTRSIYSRSFAKGSKKAWWIRLATTLDGEFQISATVPRGSNPEVALVGADRKSVVKRAQWIGQRVKRLEGSVCGQRAQFLRITPRGAAGSVRVSVALP